MRENCSEKDKRVNETALRVSDLRKVYGDTVAIDGISFEVCRGGGTGLLGPNGAGKTSTLECLEGLRRPDGSPMDVMGIDPAQAVHKLHLLVGVQLQSSALPPSMTVDEAMRFFCAYHGVAPRYDLIERLGLGPKRKAQFRELSTGLARRLALALAVAHKPPVVFLDEPTTELDVGSRAELHAMIGEFREGTTVILATHDVAEAEKLADRVSILLRGRIGATGSPTPS